MNKKLLKILADMLEETLASDMSPEQADSIVCHVCEILNCLSNDN